MVILVVENTAETWGSWYMENNWTRGWHAVGDPASL